MAPPAAGACPVGGPGRAACLAVGPGWRWPILHFLFLLNDGLVKPEIWAEYFQAARPGQLMVWAHCTNHSACEADPGLELIEAKLVPTVWSRHLVDLVSPMVQLIRFASAHTERVAASGNLTEKFVLLSDSHLPIKPFSVAYQRIFHEPSSDFCHMVPTLWSRGIIDGMPRMIVRHHEWLTLDRRDALIVVRDWKSWAKRRSNDIRNPYRWGVPLEGAGGRNGTRRTVPRFDFTENIIAGAKDGRQRAVPPDEEAPYALIHGALQAQPGDTAKTNHVWKQRRCFTYVEFPTALGLPRSIGTKTYYPGRAEGWGQLEPHTLGIKFNVSKAILSGDGNLVIVGPKGGSPLLMEVLNADAMVAMRRSTFLFARKFASNASLPGFAEIMFGTAA